jgi:hypothetical protein
MSDVADGKPIELYERDKRKTVVKDSSFCTIREAKRFATEQAEAYVNVLRKEIVEPRLNEYASVSNAAAEKMELAAAAATQVMASLSREVIALQKRVHQLEAARWGNRWRGFLARLRRQECVHGLDRYDCAECVDSDLATYDASVAALANAAEPSTHIEVPDAQPPVS